MLICFLLKGHDQNLTQYNACNQTSAEFIGAITSLDLETLVELMQFLIAFFFTLTTNLTSSQNIIKVPLLFSEYYLNITSTSKNILLLYRSKSTFKATYTYISVFLHIYL